MKYTLQCECGQEVTVSAGDAGSTVNCACGKAVPVPGLSELKRTSHARTSTPQDEEQDDSARRRGLIGLVVAAAGFLTSCITSAMPFKGYPHEHVLAFTAFTMSLSGSGTGLFGSARGHPFFVGFLLGAFCGPLGVLIVFLMPPKKR